MSTAAAEVPPVRPTAPYLTLECHAGPAPADAPHGCHHCPAPGYEHPQLGWVDLPCTHSCHTAGSP